MKTEEQIKCPFCENDINGDYFPCKQCNDTGLIDKNKASKE